jgi:hypothetical protein
MAGTEEEGIAEVGIVDGESLGNEFAKLLLLIS